MSEAEILEIQIEDLSRGGAGVARTDDGQVVFVPFTAPGDQVRLAIVDRKKKFLQGKLLEVLIPSSHRITPRCPVFTQCGGCDWQHLPYAFQWKTKVSGISHVLKRTGLSTHPTIEELPAEQIWNYRNRIQLRGEKGTLGFHARGSNRVVPIESCDIARMEINEVLPEARREALRFQRPYKLEIEVDSQNHVQKAWNARHGFRGFRQVHDGQNLKLQNWVKEVLSSKRRLYDLYGGSGNLSLGLLDQMTAIDCVDVFTPRVNPAPHYHYHLSGVAEWMGNALKQEKASEVASAILDPPREGLARDFTIIEKGLRHLGVQEIVLVGCDADAWARDVFRFQGKGWNLKRIAVLDLFPQTHHVEALAVLII